MSKESLKEIADREGYGITRSFFEGKQAKYLRWGEASHVENPTYFDRRFPYVPTLEYRLDRTFPLVTFLKSYLWDEWDEHLLWYRELTARYAKNKGLVSPEELPAFIARRDALQKQIIRNGERIQSVFEEVRAILKVWAVQAEQGILQGRKFSSLSDEDEEILDALHDLKRTAKRLWNHVTTGTPRRVLVENWLPKALYRKGLPRHLAEAQGSGVVLQLYRRDQIIEETLPLHRRWWALEVLLKRALIDEPVLSEDELSEETPVYNRDKRVLYKQNKPWVKECGQSIMEEHPEWGSGQIVTAIQEAYAKEFECTIEESPSETTIRRYLGWK